jgi:LPS O-antigen subunit length determinant protein (WzzB/FepE family)
MLITAAGDAKEPIAQPVAPQMTLPPQVALAPQVPLASQHVVTETRSDRDSLDLLAIRRDGLKRQIQTLEDALRHEYERDIAALEQRHAYLLSLKRP